MNLPDIIMLLVVAGLFACLALVYLDSANACSHCENIAESAERYKMYNKSLKMDLRVNGVYHYDGFYCVWTDDRGAEEIAGTREHEICHALIDKNYTHFCGFD